MGRGEGEGVDKLGSHYQIDGLIHMPFFVTSCNAFPTKRRREARDMYLHPSAFLLAFKFIKQNFEIELNFDFLPLLGVKGRMNHISYQIFLPV